jgi:chaperonin GroES
MANQYAQGGILDMSQLRPLHDRIVVRRTEEAEQTRGGLYIPDTAKEKPQQGEVIAAGAGRILENGQRAPMEIKAGDVVLFGKYSGTEVRLDGEDLLIIRESDVLGIIENAAKSFAATGRG